MTRTLRGVVVSLAVALSLAACGGGGGDGDPLSGDTGGGGGVTVGSANFVESSLLAEIYAQALEAKNIKVTRKFDIGAREVYYDQVVKGGLSVVPEYNGALLATSVDKNSKATTPDQINAELKAKLPQSVEILNSAQAEDKDSITVTKATSQKHNLTSLDQLKNVAGQMTLAAGSEFKTRQQGAVGLESVYGVKFKKFQSVDAGAQSTVVKLLKDGDIQAANLYTTDPSIAAEGFVVLQDPKNLFASQNVTPLIYKSAVNATGREALNAISAKLTTQDLLDMMKRVSIDKADQETVAKDWLKKAGLVS
ncbi:ABC transporter substrate-binding protein [Actinomadura rugatobispora]|uniref:ABC transporter substrate-binding protein n=1 Tax=Actinomadura rugatobispora TaxID=1994 RepID=A0ABW0ZZH9_9ACTN|nr:ABC transporter substrate-binding protein [Actinomadura rugatobispora]